MAALPVDRVPMVSPRAGSKAPRTKRAVWGPVGPQGGEGLGGGGPRNEAGGGADPLPVDRGAKVRDIDGFL